MVVADKYKTGLIWQDFQHGQLFELFENLQKAKEQKMDKNLYQYSIAFLSMYVNHHFKLEEQYMRAYNYAEAGEHIKEHKRFIKEIKAFREAHQTYSDAAAEQLIAKLRDWISTHIIEVDMTLGKYILEYEKIKQR